MKFSLNLSEKNVVLLILFLTWWRLLGGRSREALRLYNVIFADFLKVSFLGTWSLYYAVLSISVCFGRSKLVSFICSFSCIIFFLRWENSLFPEKKCDSTSDGVCLMLFHFICSCGTKIVFSKTWDIFAFFTTLTIFISWREVQKYSRWGAFDGLLFYC